jgi:uncharacterized damage-inducible protein DinB
MERIWDLLQRSYEGGNAWHCPSLRELLGGVSAEQGLARPVSGAPTILEILLHITVYEDVVRRRIEGEPIGEVSDEMSWPRPAPPLKAAWRKAIEAFEEGHVRLRRTIADFPAQRLSEVVPGRDYPFYVMLHGTIQHLLYHAGQIEMLMVAQGVRPQASPMATRFGAAVSATAH